MQTYLLFYFIYYYPHTRRHTTPHGSDIDFVTQHYELRCVLCMSH